MAEVAHAPKATRRWPTRVLLGVIAVASLCALGLSIYNTATFDDRVKEYVQHHPKVMGPVVTKFAPPRLKTNCISDAVDTWGQDFSVDIDASDPQNPVGTIGAPGVAPDLAGC